MKVEIEPARYRRPEYSVERRIGLFVRCAPEERQPTEYAAMLRDGFNQRAELRFVVQRHVDRIECRRLQRDAAFPFLAHLCEQRPGDRDLLRGAIDMRAQRAGAVREGAA